MLPKEGPPPVGTQDKAAAEHIAKMSKKQRIAELCGSLKDDANRTYSTLMAEQSTLDPSELQGRTFKSLDDEVLGEGYGLAAQEGRLPLTPPHTPLRKSGLGPQGNPKHAKGGVQNLGWQVGNGFGLPELEDRI